MTGSSTRMDGRGRAGHAWAAAATVTVALLAAGVAAGQPSASHQEGPEEVTVYAASSLTNAFQAVADRLLKGEGLRLRLSFAGSSSLARQIENGAPADLYASANVRWMAYLTERGAIAPETRLDLLRNRLVVIAPKDEAFEVRAERGFDFPGAFTGRLAVADPDHVPAGIYARQALESLGWWRALSGRLAPALDVRGALAYVERGACPAGIVYRTDAAASTGVAVLAELPSRTHDPIVYPVAAVKGRDGAATLRVLALLQTEPVLRIFADHGFLVPER